MNLNDVSQLEPVWIRDVQAAEIDLDTSDPGKLPEMLSMVCEGEKSCCEHCGANFPLWPTKGWADHLLTEHGHNLTIQARTGTSLLCTDELGTAQQLFFSMMLGSRISMRRRAWKLGYVIVKNASTGSLLRN